jgi:hypothetical protein
VKLKKESIIKEITIKKIRIALKTKINKLNNTFIF